MISIKTYRGLDKIEVVGKKGDIIKLGDYKTEDGYFDLTKLSRRVKINMHNFNRSALVVNSKRDNIMFEDGFPLFKTTMGNGGKSLIHPIIMVSVLRALNFDYFMKMDKIILENL